MIEILGKFTFFDFSRPNFFLVNLKILRNFGFGPWELINHVCPNLFHKLVTFHPKGCVWHFGLDSFCKCVLNSSIKSICVEKEKHSWDDDLRGITLWSEGVCDRRVKSNNLDMKTEKSRTKCSKKTLHWSTWQII